MYGVMTGDLKGELALRPCSCMALTTCVGMFLDKSTCVLNEEFNINHSSKYTSIILFKVPVSSFVKQILPSDIYAVLPECCFVCLCYLICGFDDFVFMSL